MHHDVLIVGGTTDVIAPVPCVERACDVLTGARSIRFETAPGSHLGVLSGPEARDTTWRYISDFLASVAQPGAEPRPDPVSADTPPAPRSRRTIADRLARRVPSG